MAGVNAQSDQAGARSFATTDPREIDLLLAPAESRGGALLAMAVNAPRGRGVS